MSIIHDIRYYCIIPFLDMPTCHAFLLTQRPRQPIFITLLEKQKQCKQAWRFHGTMPQEIKIVSDLSLRTRTNLRNLSLRYGFTWDENHVHAWHIKRRRRESNVLDLMIPGKHPTDGRVQYWRHETMCKSAGQTFLLYIDRKGKRKRQSVSLLLQ